MLRPMPMFILNLGPQLTTLSVLGVPASVMEYSITRIYLTLTNQQVSLYNGIYGFGRVVCSGK